MIVRNTEELKAWADKELPSALLSSIQFTGLTNKQHDEVIEIVRGYIKKDGIEGATLSYTRDYTYKVLSDYYRETGDMPDGCSLSTDYDLKRLESATETDWDGDTMVYDSETDKYYDTPDDLAEEIWDQNLTHSGFAFATVAHTAVIDIAEVLDNADEMAGLDEGINWDGTAELQSAFATFNEANKNNARYYEPDYTRKIKIVLEEK